MRVGAVLTTVLVSAGLLALAGSAQAQTAPTLGTAGSFAVLGSSGVTNTGFSVVSGDLGSAPNPAITGFPPGLVVNGTTHANDGVAIQARSDSMTAYGDLAGQPCDVNLSGQDLGGLTLTSGVYCFDSSAQLTGALTLDAEGNPDAVFIFQIGSTLTTASGSSVVLINNADACNVFWQVGSSATLGTATSFVGTVIANTSITAVTDATVDGRLLALTGAVTLDSNDITAPTCTPGGGTTGGTTAGTTTGGTTAGTTTGGAIAGTTTGGTIAGTTTGGVIAGTTTGGLIAGTTTGGVIAGTTTGGTIAGSTTGGTGGGGDHHDGDHDKGDRDKGDRDKGDRDKGDRDKGDRDKGDYDKGDHDKK